MAASTSAYPVAHVGVLQVDANLAQPFRLMCRLDSGELHPAQA
jgi:hypothetical protein